MQERTMAVKSRLRAIVAQQNYERAEAGQPELSIRGIAHDAGLSASVVSGLMSNRAKRLDMTTLDRLCRFFGVQPGDILVYTPDESEGAADA
jgi:putative transcriptional regulator